MWKAYTFLNEMRHLCKDIEDSILFSLLLIRKISHRGTAERSCPANSLWDYVLRNSREDSLEAVAQVLRMMEPQFPVARMLLERNRNQVVENAFLVELIHLISEIPADDFSLSDVFEDYLRLGAVSHKTMSASGDFYTPRSIAQCLAFLLDPQQGTVYDPCCGSGALLAAAQNYANQSLTLYGQTLDKKSYVMAQMNLLLKGISVDLGTKPQNTLLRDQHENKRFDYILANPPFNSKNWLEGNLPDFDPRWQFGIPPVSNANFAWLQHILSHLAPGGRAAVLLPNSTLTTQTRKEFRIRRAIVQNRQIEAIITLPPGLFYATKVPCCIWLLSGSERSRQDILFVDTERMPHPVKKQILPEQMAQIQDLVCKYRYGALDGCTQWYGVASEKEMEENDFLLSPNRYLAQVRPHPRKIRREYGNLERLMEEVSGLPGAETVLPSILPWKRAPIAATWQKATLPELYDVFGGVTKKKEFWGKGFPLLDLKTVIHTAYVPDRLQSYVEVTQEEQEKYNIQYGDVFLNRTSETIEELACCCVALKEQKAVYSGFVKRLRPRKPEIIDPLYAACYFRSEIYRWEVEKASAAYTTRASLNNKTLWGISFYFPDGETQKKFGETLFSLSRYRQQCSDDAHCRLLLELEEQLIRQYVTYPILCIQNKDGDRLCR